MKKIFIDGKAGTTGLRIFERLSSRNDIKLITLSEERRKDDRYRREALNEADIAFLCLPDAAAVAAVEMIENSNTVVIDTSTAHRTAPGWVYGFPELSPEHETKIRSSKRIAVPGCHASGFIALVYPLVEAGILDSAAMLICHSLTGYSGGGKSMIAEYESDGHSALLGAPRQYGLTQTHKHLREMQSVTSLSTAPIFCPIVADFYSGMEVTLPLFRENLTGGATIDDVRNAYEKKYSGPVVSFCASADENGFLSAASLSGKDGMKITVCGNEDRILPVAIYDNLGKGASGAAVQCLNLVMGADPTTGLEL